MSRFHGDQPDGTRPGLSVTRRGAGEELTITLSGELTAAEGDLDLLGDHLDRDVRHVVVDVTGLDFADVAGLRTLVRAQQACEERKVSFTLLRPSSYLSWLLDLTGTTALLISATTDDGELRLEGEERRHHDP